MLRCKLPQVLHPFFTQKRSTRSHAKNLCFTATLITALTVCAFGRDVGLFRVIHAAKMVSGGVGAMRSNATSTITISGIPATGTTIIASYLYWHGPTNSLDPNVNASILLNGSPVTGTNIGFSDNNCWGFQNSQAYRADVTSLVTGNGAYVLSGYAPNSTSVATTNGASIIVFYTDGDTANYRDFALLDGNDSNIDNPYDAPGWTVTVSGINYSGTGTANLWMHVSDGQSFLDDALVLNGVTIVPAGPIFQGASVPPAVTGGNLWDIKSFNVQPELTEGLNTLTLTTGLNNDCLSDIADVYDLPTGSATVVPGLVLTPPLPSTAAVGQSVKVIAGASLNGNPSASDIVSFSVNGANTTSGTCTTDATGRCSFTYSGTNVGKDLITAQTTISGTPVNATPVSETWTEGGSTLTLSPKSSIDLVGQGHVVTATIAPNNPASQNVTVNFVVTGANPTNGSCITGTNGTCPFSYTGIFAGTDLITATAALGETTLQATANETWRSSQIQTQTYPSSTIPQTKIFPPGQNPAPAAQSLALTVPTVINPIVVKVEFHYEATELAAGRAGVGIADGVCESGATEATDFDCRLAQGGFVYQTLNNGDQVVPHIIPSHNNLGVWVRVTATRVSDGRPAVAGVDYTGPIDWYYAWNTNPPLIPSPILEAPVSTASSTSFVNPEYAPGWNNLNPQMYDRRGSDPDIAFKFNITTYAKFNCNPTCVGTNDPGLGGRTPTLNDVVAADPPNPPSGSADVEVTIMPVPGISPYAYSKRGPMPIVFALQKQGTGISDPTALTLPHSVNVAVLDPVTGLRQPVVTFPGFPTTFTYYPFFKVYYIFLSSEPYTVGKVYQLQINSDLFPEPVNAKFVMTSF